MKKNILDQSSKNIKSKPRRTRLEKEVHFIIKHWIIERDAPFTFEMLLESVQKLIDMDISPFLLEKYKPSMLVKIANQVLDQNPWVFYDKTQEEYIPRRMYFLNSFFKINPTSEEIENGILFPGHRFFPFHYIGLLPSECIFIWKYGRIPTKQYSSAICDVMNYHSLFDWESCLAFFMCNHEKNEEILANMQDLKSTISLKVFDMKEFYRAFNFMDGDALICRVLDWANGLYEIDYSPKSKFENLGEEGEQWICDLENALHQEFAESESYNVFEQLSGAFFRSGKDLLLTKPYYSILEFLEKSNNISLKVVGRDTFLWDDDNELHEMIWNSLIRPHAVNTGRLDSLNVILKELNVSWNKSVLEGFMQDHVSHGGTDWKGVLKRCLPNLSKKSFFSKEQEAKFYYYVNALWEKVVKNYNVFRDRDIKAVRKKLVDLLALHYHWVDDVFIHHVRCNDVMEQWALMVQFIQDMEYILSDIVKLYGVSATKKKSKLPDVSHFMLFYQSLKRDMLQSFQERPTLRIVESKEQE
ncbi:MAG: hypothetical protein KBC30_06000 [Planctomycetes bacterium]|nr:hypothetical protein [Planctomycetota bacterium]